MKHTKQYRNNSIGLLEAYGLESDLPIDIRKLASQLNINVNYENINKDISGKILFNPVDDKTTIIINNDEPEFRQRFSLAHEIAHYIYDIDFNEYSEIEDTVTHFRKMSKDPIERRADKYAEKILMPAKIFREKAKEQKEALLPNTGKSIGYKNIYKIVITLSSMFNVSKPAIIYRLHSLKIINENTRRKLFDYHYL